MATRAQKWLAGVAASLVVAFAVGGAGAGLNGLATAASTETKVERLEGEQAGVRVRLRGVEERLATLEGAVRSEVERDAEYRAEQREAIRALDAKLTELLRRR